MFTSHLTARVPPGQTGRVTVKSNPEGDRTPEEIARSLKEALGGTPEIENNVKALAYAGEHGDPKTEVKRYPTGRRPIRLEDRIDKKQLTVFVSSHAWRIVKMAASIFGMSMGQVVEAAIMQYGDTFLRNEIKNHFLDDMARKGRR